MSTKRFDGRESGIERRLKSADLQQFLASRLGQHCPSHCPTQPEPVLREPAASGAASRLGQPLDIRQVARLVGCSPWSIRNTWMPRGLPFFRLGASSKLHFWEVQVVAWIERQQQGGTRR